MSKKEREKEGEEREVGKPETDRVELAHIKVERPSSRGIPSYVAGLSLHRSAASDEFSMMLCLTIMLPRRHFSLPSGLFPRQPTRKCDENTPTRCRQHNIVPLLHVKIHCGTEHSI